MNYTAFGTITHKSSGQKTAASGTLLVDVATDIKLDVTIVMQKSPSAFGWAQYSGAVTQAATSNPTYAPSLKPTASPVKPPTPSPTNKPTV
jgi:hypothetical protein